MKKMLAMAAGLALSLAVTAASGEDKLKVAFLYVGPIGDHGWTYTHDQGRLMVEDQLGDQVETVYVENVPEGPDAERAITRLVRDGAGLVFTTSFGYMDPTIKVAENFPEVKFEHATGYKRSDNVSTYIARFYEGRYVIGQIAAKMSKSGVAGYVASFPIPEVVRGINAFMLGAQSVNPDFKVKVVWVNSWFDPGKEKDAAEVMIGQGADIISQHTDSTAPIQTAQEKGVLGFGQASDMIHFAPKAQLTSIIDNWGPYYVARTQAVLDGTWESSDTWGRDGRRHGRDGPLHEHAGGCGRDGDGDGGEDPHRRHAPLHRSHLPPGRRDGHRRRRAPRRRRPARHELVREGRRRRAAAIAHAAPLPHPRPGPGKAGAGTFPLLTEPPRGNAP